MWELRMEVWKDYFIEILSEMENRIMKGVIRRRIGEERNW